MTSLFIFVVHSIIEIFFNQIWTNTREAQITINTEQIIKFQSANNMPECSGLRYRTTVRIQFHGLTLYKLYKLYKYYKLKVRAQSIW